MVVLYCISACVEIFLSDRLRIGLYEYADGITLGIDNLFRVRIISILRVF